MATFHNVALPRTDRFVRTANKVLAEHPNGAPLRLLSVVIPAHNEEGCICSTVEHLHLELRLHNVPHEIVTVDDGSTDSTWDKLLELTGHILELKPVQNQGEHGFGRAVAKGFDSMTGDAVVVMMADESDDCRDVVRYWELLNQGWDAVFGSRFIKGGGVVDYPWLKHRLNRMGNFFIRLMFGIKLNDTTNAFKAYRASVIEGCRPLLSPHFNLTVELPLKTIVRGYSWTVTPITWNNRRSGISKLAIKEMGSRYLFICLYVWLEKYFSRGDYKKREETVTPAEMEVPMDLTTTTRQVGSIAIVDITGRIVLGEESSALRNLVADLLKNGHKKILFNLANVSYIDSSGLGQLISTFITVRKQDGELKLFGLNNEVHDLLQITKLCTVFDISDNEAAAVKSFTRSAATA